MSGRMVRFLAVVGSVLAVLFAACASDEEEPAGGAQGPAWTDITPDQLAGMIDDEDVMLVNVHIPYEGEIPGTDAFIPYDQVADHTDELPNDEATRLVLYCRSGRMSVDAATTLAGMGYTNLYNLTGGYTGWAAAGYELVT